MDIALIIAADEPAIFYRTIKAAELDLEAADVENGVYRAAYGPNGKVYDIDCQDDTVVIAPAEEPSRPLELKRVLLDFLAAMHIDVDEYAGLEDLLKKCEPYAQG